MTDAAIFLAGLALGCFLTGAGIAGYVLVVWTRERAVSRLQADLRRSPSRG